MNKISKLIRYLCNMIKYIRQGGVVYMNLAQLNQGGILKGKRILITGGTSGIGYCIAKKFLSEGASVVITGRDSTRVKEALSSLNSERVYGLAWNVSDVSIIEERFGKVVKLIGGLDILVNNAGVYTNKKAQDIDVETWDSLINTNIKGVFFICQTTVSHFINVNREKGGKIINISSIRGTQGDNGPYGISKWGVNCLTKGLARDFIGKNIIVNAIAPGMTATGINGIDIAHNAYCSESGNKRIGLPEDMAELALFLAGDASNNITGQIITCDGGSTIQ